MSYENDPMAQELAQFLDMPRGPLSTLGANALYFTQKTTPLPVDEELTPENPEV